MQPQSELLIGFMDRDKKYPNKAPSIYTEHYCIMIYNILQHTEVQIVSATYSILGVPYFPTWSHAIYVPRCTF